MGTIDKTKADASKAAFQAGDFQLSAALLAELRADDPTLEQGPDGTVCTRNDKGELVEAAP